ncbi:MAG TPA: DUF433 domain-containing protein [Gemmataceae bacterium]|jgi:uncharacterized protein (DUF433 family)|nr:DUF433 domain-containing protein [Gemmataceae bacterium]
MKPARIGRYLVKDPGVCHGKLTFKGTRVPVQTVLGRVSKGKSIDDILKSWPELRRAAIVEAINMATASLVERYESQPETVHEPANP